MTQSAGRGFGLPKDGGRAREGQVAGIARASADVPWCHFASADVRITWQMLEVEALAVTPATPKVCRSGVAM